MKRTEFHKKIRRDILSTKMTLRALSLSMNWHQNRCNRFWSGEHHPSFRYLVTFCKTIHKENWKQHLLEYAELLEETTCSKTN
jgi:hypothetical protein